MWSGRFREPLDRTLDHRQRSASLRSRLVMVVALSPAVSLLQAQAQAPDHFTANDRLRLLPITHSFTVAEPNSIPLQVTDPHVKSVFVDWGTYPPGSTISVDAHESNTPAFSLLPGPHGTSIIQFTPSVLGKLNLGVIVFFEDGGIASKDEDVEAILPTRLPEKFIFQRSADQSWNTNSMYATVGRNVGLDAAAYYSGFAKPVHVPPASVVFHVLNEPGSKPLQLDPATGIIKPIAPGRALIQADFAGLITFTCIHVFPSTGGGTADDCHDLLPSGKSLPPQPKFTPPTIRVSGPSTSTSR
jgi:hypothetical protein